CLSCISTSLSVISSLSLHDALPIFAFRRKIQGRPVLLLGLVLAALPAVYVGLVWTRLMPESYIRFARPFLGLVAFPAMLFAALRSEEHTSELQSRENLVCRLLLEKK